MLLLHIGAFHLDVDSKRSTFWHDLTPQTRMLFMVLFVFAVALTPNGRWLTWATYGAGLAIVLFISQITFPILLRRVAVEFTFIGVVLLGTLFREGGEILWQWGWFRITTHGLIVLGSVSLKAMLSLLMVNLLVLTTSIPAMLHALVKLKTPPLLVAILASMYRYTGVLIDEFSSMRRAAASRNLMGSDHFKRMVVGNMMGSLFIRTYDRGDRVYQAMLSRGYTGLPPTAEFPEGKTLDIVAITVTVIWLLIGQAVYLVNL